MEKHKQLEKSAAEAAKAQEDAAEAAAAEAAKAQEARKQAEEEAEAKAKAKEYAEAKAQEARKQAEDAAAAAAQEAAEARKQAKEEAADKAQEDPQQGHDTCDVTGSTFKSDNNKLTIQLEKDSEACTDHFNDAIDDATPVLLQNTESQITLIDVEGGSNMCNKFSLQADHLNCITKQQYVQYCKYPQEYQDDSGDGPESCEDDPYYEGDDDVDHEGDSGFTFLERHLILFVTYDLAKCNQDILSELGLVDESDKSKMQGESYSKTYDITLNRQPKTDKPQYGPDDCHSFAWNDVSFRVE